MAGVNLRLQHKTEKWKFNRFTFELYYQGNERFVKLLSVLTKIKTKHSKKLSLQRKQKHCRGERAWPRLRRFPSGKVQKVNKLTNL